MLLSYIMAERIDPNLVIRDEMNRLLRLPKPWMTELSPAKQQTLQLWALQENAQRVMENADNLADKKLGLLIKLDMDIAANTAFDPETGNEFTTQERASRIIYQLNKTLMGYSEYSHILFERYTPVFSDNGQGSERVAFESDYNINQFAKRFEHMAVYASTLNRKQQPSKNWSVFLNQAVKDKAIDAQRW